MAEELLRSQSESELSGTFEHLCVESLQSLCGGLGIRSFFVWEPGRSDSASRRAEIVRA